MGNISLVGASSGSTTLVPQATGTYTVTLPAATGTLAITASPTFTGVTTESTITSPAATALTIQSAGTTAMTIDTLQNALIGTTSTNPAGSRVTGVVLGASGTVYSNSLSQSYFAIKATSGTNVGFFTDNGSALVTAGSISSNGSTTSFNTSSDYRLKESITPLTTGLETVKALNPVNYVWTGNQERGEGFLAHELQNVIPLAVTGAKDAVDADGNPQYQGVDYSKIVVHLVAAIQELSAKNDALEARLAALEAK
jgi:hypothetical protein